MLAAIGIFRSAQAHCLNSPRNVVLQHPSDSVAIQITCYQDLGNCLTDTFSVGKLRQELAAKYSNSKYAAFACEDSVTDFPTYDTILYHNQVYYVDTLLTERIKISIVGNLKDTLTTQHLTYVDRWVAALQNPNPATYRSLVGTPFVAFFNAYDSIGELGIGPLDGCFMEPTAYALSQDGIHKKGMAGQRMPGVSVTLDDFFKTVGHASMATLSCAGNTAIRRLDRMPAKPNRRPGLFYYNLQGRTLRLRSAGPSINRMGTWETTDILFDAANPGS